jgi:hypothetical protein
MPNILLIILIALAIAVFIYAVHRTIHRKRETFRLLALDSHSNRASSVGILLPFILAPPAPDGTISQADRQHIIKCYGGILATSSVPTTTTPTAALDLCTIGTPL